MDIPINAEVYCADGLCGHSTYIVLNPTNEEITHFVLRELQFPKIERLVPIHLIIRSTPTRITLRCRKVDLSKMGPFIKNDFLSSDLAGYGDDPYLLWPYAVPDSTGIPIVEEQIPLEELAIRRDATVKATDGRIGKVDEFLVNPENDHITHLILREGHLWGQRDVTIPVSQIERIEEQTVYLKLDKRAVQALPTVPVKNRRPSHKPV
jgi:sporulation protein YlmC with PRC-barrel domain